MDNLIERGLDPKVCRLFIVDGAKALTKVIRSTFGRHTPIQRCQIHKARNVIERLPKPLHASARKALRQAWEAEHCPCFGVKLPALSARRQSLVEITFSLV